MKKTICVAVSLGALTALLFLGCSSDNPAAPSGGGGGTDPTILPAIPIPADVNSILPSKSAEIDVGLSQPLDNFVPVVATLEQMKDDASTAWTDENRHLKMVCDGSFSEYTCDQTLTDRAYVSESPRLLHKRYWKRLKQVILDPGTAYSKTETVEYGSSTTNTQSQSFSQTIGVEVSASAGWGPFSATVTASYEQTTTREEINSVTFSETKTFSEEYKVDSDPNKTIVYALWQLVDVLVLVDGNKVPIDQSSTLAHVTIPEIPGVEFLNRDVVRQSVTKFDPPATP
jgi:hypothetical protein